MQRERIHEERSQYCPEGEHVRHEEYEKIRDSVPSRVSYSVPNLVVKRG